MAIQTEALRSAPAKSFDRVVDVHDLETVSRALRAAMDEIHNPGCGRANNYDVLDLIQQAKDIVKIAVNAR